MHNMKLFLDSDRTHSITYSKYSDRGRAAHRFSILSVYLKIKAALTLWTLILVSISTLPAIITAHTA